MDILTEILDKSRSSYKGFPIPINLDIYSIKICQVIKVLK